MANTLIAKIESLGSAIKGAKDTKVQVVKLKEANGQSYEWSTFHAATFDGYEVGDVIEIVPALKWRDGQQYPYRNVGSVLGKREASEINTFDVLGHRPGETNEAPRSTNGMSDHTKAIERQSIERQTSVKLMGEIYKAGCSIDDLQMVAEAIVKAAETVEIWLARQGTVTTVKVPDPDNYGKFIDRPVNGASTTSQATSPDSYKMETVGDLFTAAHKKFKKSKADVLDTLNYETQELLLESMTPQTAWDSLLSVWEGPPAKEQPEN